MITRPYLLLLLPLALGLAACSPFTALNGLTPGGASEPTTGLSYGDGPHRKLDVYRPLDAHGKAPVVVFFYGGNWDSGERADYAFVGRALASRGIVAVVADYRLYPEVRYPDFLTDSAMAVAWAAKQAGNYGGDPKRLFVMGHSAGAYNAAMVALDSRWLAAQGLAPSALRGWIGLAGPYDFLPIKNDEIKPVFHFPNTSPDSQPVNHVSAGAPPALLIAARNDKVVNPDNNTGHLADKLRAQHRPVDERYFDKVSHATLVGSLSGPLRWLAPTLDTIAQFVNSDGGRVGEPAGAGITAAATPAQR